jgi:hypothetical protein
MRSRDSPHPGPMGPNCEFGPVCRQSGNYQLINIKVPADCFVPRLVTENAALVIYDSASRKNSSAPASVMARPVFRLTLTAYEHSSRALLTTTLRFWL